MLKSLENILELQEPAMIEIYNVQFCSGGS